MTAGRRIGVSDVTQGHSGDVAIGDPLSTNPGSARDGPLCVAVTGGIGAGKSTVSSALADCGAVVIDSDRLAREVVEPGTPGLAAVAAAFGDIVIAVDGGLDRAALAGVVFADPEARKRLEGITHPLVRQRFAQRLAAVPRGRVVINDIPLIRTVTDAARYHLVIGVGVADDEVRLRRLVSRGHTEADARARITAQIADQERRRLADVWMDNSGLLDDLGGPIDELWQRLTTFAANRLAKTEAAAVARALVPPDPEWPNREALLAARVSLACGGARVDHIGSTAIPGPPAKDVIALQLIVESLDQADGLEPALSAAGFPRSPGNRRDTPHLPRADPSAWQEKVHGNADPGQQLNLHLRVRP